MSLTIVGPRILLKVPKFTNKNKKYEGSSLYMPEEFLDKETQYQTVGVVDQIGPAVTKTYEGFDDLKIGDRIHFQRYGAARVKLKEAEDFEYWIINGKDVLLIDNEVLEETQPTEVTHE